MGDSREQTVQTSLSMKFLVVLALFAMAMAEPEADAQLLYNYNYNYPLNYNYPYNYNYAYNYPSVYHYGKREAEAEPEAEADPALIYTANPLPLPTAVPSPLVYKTLPVAEKTEQVSTPLVYTHAIPHHQPVVYKTLPLAEKTVSVQQPIVYNAGVQTPLVYNSAVQTPLVYNTPLVNTVYNAPLTTPFMTKIFPSLKTMSPPAVSHITKREAEAEADPALVYTTAGVHQPIVYNSALQTPLVYTVYNTAVPAVHSTLLKTVDNAVVPAVGGYIHSSHVGVCTNNVGVRVPC